MIRNEAYRPSGPADTAIEERVLDGGPAISAAAHLARPDVASWFMDALAGLRAIATAAGLERTGPAGGLYDDELFTQDAGHARVYLPVADSPALDGTGARWELPAGRFAVALHAGPHRDVDRTYAALGTYAGAHGRDGSGPVRERYLVDPLGTAGQQRLAHRDLLAAGPIGRVATLGKPGGRGRAAVPAVAVPGAAAAAVRECAKPAE